MDLDGDGKLDILSGSYSHMDPKQPMAGHFQVLWGQADGPFKKAEVLNGTDGKPLAMPTSRQNPVKAICTRPFAVDWDGDGKLDLVVGNFLGTFYLFKGEGKGKFAPGAEPINTDKGPLKVNYHGDPFVIDWDGDGDLDLLSGSMSGGVQWAENTAGKGKPPVLKDFQTLIKPGPQVEYGGILHEQDLKGPAGSLRVWAADVNGDGKLDLLVGDDVTLVSPADGIDEEEYKARFAAWRKDQEGVNAQYQAAGNDAKKQQEAGQKMSELYNKRKDFTKEDMTGFVWLYLQK